MNNKSIPKIYYIIGAAAIFLQSILSTTLYELYDVSFKLQILLIVPIGLLTGLIIIAVVRAVLYWKETSVQKNKDLHD